MGSPRLSYSDASSAAQTALEGPRSCGLHLVILPLTTSISIADNQQDRTNQRLAVLTVISAIFLPLTLLAGIYGMNFDVMPELHYRYAYPLVIGLMVAVAIGMILYFRTRGWFK